MCTKVDHRRDGIIWHPEYYKKGGLRGGGLLRFVNQRRRSLSWATNISCFGVLGFFVCFVFFCFPEGWLWSAATVELFHRSFSLSHHYCLSDTGWFRNLDSRPTSLASFTHWKILFLFLKLNLKRQPPKTTTTKTWESGILTLEFSVEESLCPLIFHLLHHHFVF